MPDIISGVVGGSSLLGGLFGDKASDRQSDAAGRGIDTQMAQFQEIRKLLMPFIEQGQFGMEGRQDILGQLQNWGDTGLQRVRQNPLTQGLLRSAEEAVLANASATGGLRGGNVQSALARTRTGLLSNLENQQYGRTAGLYDAYNNIVGQGQGAASALAGFGANNANQIAALMEQQGAAQAGGDLAWGNAFSGGLAGLGGLFAGRRPSTGGAASMGAQWNDYSPFGGMGMQNYDYIDSSTVVGGGF